MEQIIMVPLVGFEPPGLGWSGSLVLLGRTTLSVRIGDVYIPRA
jgi:hypothetical protein